MRDGFRQQVFGKGCARSRCQAVGCAQSRWSADRAVHLAGRQPLQCRRGRVLGVTRPLTCASLWIAYRSQPTLLCRAGAVALLQVAFRKLRQEWIDMGYGVPPESVKPRRGLAPDM